jgi:hypothetical protein
LSRCREVSALSAEAHRITSGEAPGILSDLEAEIDECARQVWGLTQNELAAIRQSSQE